MLNKSCSFIFCKFHSRCMKNQNPPNLSTHTQTHFLNWKWNAAVFPSALWISPLICHERYPRKEIFHKCPHQLWLFSLTPKSTDAARGALRRCRSTKRQHYTATFSASYVKLMNFCAQEAEKEEVCWVKAEFRKISMSPSVNKSVGGIVFVSLAPSPPGP